MPTQLNIPGLQRVGNHSCIVCGARADLYCARCGVTPYCSEHCQRRDWTPRHSAVCHNLVRLNAANNQPADIDTNTNISIPPPPAPLRRPRSPNSNQQRAQYNGGNDNKKKFVPQTNQYNRQPQDNQWRNKENKPQEIPPTTSGGGSPTKQKMQPKPNYEKPKTKFDVTKKNFEAPKSNVEAPKSNFEVSKSNVEAPKSNVEAPKSNGGTPKSYEAPKPNFEAPKPKLEMPKEELKEVKTVEVNTETSVKLSAPEMVLVPSEYLIEKLPIGEAFLASVDKCTPAGFVCVSMHAQLATLYETLLGEICEGDPIVPKLGTTFAYFDPTDEGWYRARCLSSTECALLDAGRVANIGQGQCKPLATICADIPEFCCVVNNGKLDVGMSVQCTILMKEGDGYKVSIDADDTYLGEGSVTRWLPEVQVTPKPKDATHPRLKKFSNITSPSAQKSPAKKPEENQQLQQNVQTPQKNVQTLEQNVQTPQQNVQTPQQNVQKPQQNVQTPLEIAQKAQQIQKPVSKLPEVERPDIINNGRYVLLHVTSFQRACVRACDEQSTKEFESVIQDAALYGAQNGKRLTEAPSPGQAVLCLYESVHYRALVTRTKAADNRFKVEYVEYGNEEIVSLDKLFHCPPELCPSSRAARASLVSLSAAARELAGEALAYIDALKEEVEVVATIPSGDKTAPSGSLVQLSIARNKENINKKLEQMCTPEWKKLEIAGGDVIESSVVMLSDMKTLPLPTNKPFTLRITDVASLKVGIISGYDESTTVASVVYGSLTDKINEYCKSSLCKEPYIPAIEEVCLARLEPYPQWFRAVVISHKAGEETASVLYLDYGNVGHDVPVRSLRKCMPEFCAQPALASIIVIQDWPETVTDAQLIKALEYLEVDVEEGTGKLLVSRCQVTEDDTYTIKHEQLLAALRG